MEDVGGVEVPVRGLARDDEPEAGEGATIPHGFRVEDAGVTDADRVDEEGVAWVFEETFVALGNAAVVEEDGGALPVDPAAIVPFFPLSPFLLLSSSLHPASFLSLGLSRQFVLTVLSLSFRRVLPAGTVSHAPSSSADFSFSSAFPFWL